MWSRVFVFLIGAVYIYHQVLASDVYIAELMVESNVTLDAQTILSVLNTTSSLQVNDGSGNLHTVTFLFSELVADCLIVGDQSSCNCSSGYIWSNEVCYTYNCCREITCTQNVSYITPLCVAKVQVHINGTVISQLSWDNTKTTQLVTAFGGLNGFEYLNVTSQVTSLVNTIADFEAAVSVKFPTSKLQDIVNGLQTSLQAVLLIDTYGIVVIEAPASTVCYKSSPRLNCTFEEMTDSSGWNISTQNQRFELNNGSVVKLNNSCWTQKYNSCVTVTLDNVTGIWSGIYECGFTKGSIRHTAKAQLSVALLPDEINLNINPLTVDCSTQPPSVKVTATILNSIESFEVWWSFRDERKDNLANTSVGENLEYTFKAEISCQVSTEAQYVNVTFKNSLGQIKSARVDIPVIYVGKSFCREEILNGEFWPMTPAGNTVINQTCAGGKTGYKSRTCNSPDTWQPVFSYCISQELNIVVNAANNFLQGLGATQEVAMNIFEGLRNTSALNSNPKDTTADIVASINIFDVMAKASRNIVLQDEIFPDFINAASNMLNKSWDGVNQSVVYHMASQYLVSVEDLVKNTQVNKSNGVDSQNLELKFCSRIDCNVSTFDISVNLNMTTGMMKTIAVKNLMNRLRNNFDNAVPTSLLLSATLEDNNDSSVEIKLEFPTGQWNGSKPLCVYWNTTSMDWSGAGCIVKTGNGNRTFCVCNHLTSFSVLMSKGDISTNVLDIITNVGLGVSVCSLLIFLTIEFLVWSVVVKTNLSHFRHTALVNIAVFLLLADCSFLASTSPGVLSSSWCLSLTVCKHLFFLAMFSWMLCLSVMLVHQLIFVFSPLRKRVFMFLSSIMGYVCPILIVGSSYVYCKYTNQSYYDPKTCWLVFEGLLVGSIHAFLLPVGTVIFTNLFSMVVVIVTLLKSSVPDASKADDKETAKSILKVVVFLTPVFGITWGIGFALLMLKRDNPFFTIANYSFTILNSFQGFFILLTGCFTEQKVREELLRIITAKSKGKDDSTKNLTSTTYTKDK